MKRHQGLLILTVFLLAALLVGCSDKSTSLDVGGGGGTAATATAVGIDVCNNCHANTAVNGEAVFLAWSVSRHGNSNDSPSYPPSASCIPCHDPDGDSANLIGYAGPGSTPAPRNVVGCEACHGGGSLHFGVGPIGFFAKVATTGKSSQYNTCTGCHPDSNPFHSVTTEPELIIIDTHFDNGARAAGSDLQGYVIRTALETSCGDCHIAHEFDLTENLQWKASAHGDVAGAGWKNYDWKLASRQSCQQCHTTTGFVNYTNDQLTYDPANNVFAAVDNQSEMLYCYGCHQSGEHGMLAARRVVDNAYLQAGPGTANTVVITGQGDSELCINCHSGREPGAQIKANLAASPTGPDNTSFGSFNSHYLLAAATLFQDNTFSAADNQFIGPGAYQFVGKSYAKPSLFEHDIIGTPADPTATTAAARKQGACVGCHMTSPAGASNDPTYGSHIFLPFHLDGAGAIDNVTSASCVGCHVGGLALTPAGLNNLKTVYKNRIAELKTALEGVGIFYNINRYPYFYANAGSTTQFKTWATKAASLGLSTEDLVGIAYNLNYFSHEPGAWAHNDYYTQRVLFDSIEKLGVAPTFTRDPS